MRKTNIPLSKGKYPERIYWGLFIFFIFLKCLYYQFATQLNTWPVFSLTNIIMMVSSLSMVLVVTAILMLVFNRKRLVALFAADVLLTVLLAADTNFFRYYYGILTIPVILQINLKLVSSVNESIMSLFKPLDLLYLADLPLMLAGLVWFMRQGIREIPVRKRTVAALVTLALSMACFLGVRSNAGTGGIAYSSNYITKTLGVLYSHYDSTRHFLKKELFEGDSLTSEEKKAIESFYADKKPTAQKYKGIAQGSNLIVVQVEALQQFVINRTVNGREITPNLNKLVKESLYFDNFYYQVGGGNTSDAELLLNTSLHPLKEGSVHTRFPENKFFSLADALRAQGYKTYAMHAFRGDFYNRENMYLNLGFDRFFDQDDFVMDEFAGWQCDALSDASFFRQSLEKIETGQPFYSFLITLSSHHPFTYFEDYAFDVGDLQGTHMGNYIKAANYADQCLGEFIEALKQKGLFDTSLLVIYGDHSAVPRFLSQELTGLLGVEDNEYEWIKLQKVPMIMHYPGLKNGETVSVIGGQIDLYPTIANLLGIEARYAMGKDLLNTENGYAVLRNGSIITDSYIYINDSGSLYSTRDGTLLDKKGYQRQLNKYMQHLNVSDLIIEKDAFTSLKK